MSGIHSDEMSKIIDESQKQPEPILEVKTSSNTFRLTASFL